MNSPANQDPAEDKNIISLNKPETIDLSNDQASKNIWKITDLTSPESYKYFPLNEATNLISVSPDDCKIYCHPKIREQLKPGTEIYKRTAYYVEALKNGSKAEKEVALRELQSAVDNYQNNAPFRNCAIQISDEQIGLHFCRSDKRTPSASPDKLEHLKITLREIITDEMVLLGNLKVTITKDSDTILNINKNKKTINVHESLLILNANELKSLIKYGAELMHLSAQYPVSQGLELSRAGAIWKYSERNLLDRDALLATSNALIKLKASGWNTGSHCELFKRLLKAEKIYRNLIAEHPKLSPERARESLIKFVLRAKNISQLETIVWKFDKLYLPGFNSSVYEVQKSLISKILSEENYLPPVTEVIKLERYSEKLSNLIKNITKREERLKKKSKILQEYLSDCYRTHNKLSKIIVLRKKSLLLKNLSAGSRRGFSGTKLYGSKHDITQNHLALERIIKMPPAKQRRYFAALDLGTLRMLEKKLNRTREKLKNKIDNNIARTISTTNRIKNLRTYQRERNSELRLQQEPFNNIFNLEKINFQIPGTHHIGRFKQLKQAFDTPDELANANWPVPKTKLFIPWNCDGKNEEINEIRYGMIASRALMDILFDANSHIVSDKSDYENALSALSKGSHKTKVDTLIRSWPDYPEDLLHDTDQCKFLKELIDFYCSGTKISSSAENARYKWSIVSFLDTTEIYGQDLIPKLTEQEEKTTAAGIHRLLIRINFLQSVVPREDVFLIKSAICRFWASARTIQPDELSMEVIRQFNKNTLYAALNKGIINQTNYPLHSFLKFAAEQEKIKLTHYTLNCWNSDSKLNGYSVRYYLSQLIPHITSRDTLINFARCAIDQNPTVYHDDQKIRNLHFQLLKLVPVDIMQEVLTELSKDKKYFIRHILRAEHNTSSYLSRMLSAKAVGAVIKDLPIEEAQMLIDILPADMVPYLAAEYRSPKALLYRQAYFSAERGEEYVEDPYTGEKVLNYFCLLGLPRSVTPKMLNEARRIISWCFHPDMLLGQSAQEIEKSRQIFSTMIEAFNTLEDPELRKEYESRLPIYHHLYPKSPWMRGILKIDDSKPWEQDNQSS